MSSREYGDHYHGASLGEAAVDDYNALQAAEREARGDFGAANTLWWGEVLVAAAERQGNSELKKRGKALIAEAGTLATREASFRNRAR